LHSSSRNISLKKLNNKEKMELRMLSLRMMKLVGMGGKPSQTLLKTRRRRDGSTLKVRESRISRFRIQTMMTRIARGRGERRSQKQRLRRTGKERLSRWRRSRRKTRLNSTTSQVRRTKMRRIATRRNLMKREERRARLLKSQRSTR